MSLLNIAESVNINTEISKSEYTRKQTLSANDTETAKCGEILVSKRGDFTLFCKFCDKECFSFNTFASHIYEMHLDLNGNENEQTGTLDTEDVFQCKLLRNENVLEEKTKKDNVETSKIAQNSLDKISISSELSTLNNDLNNQESNVDDNTLSKTDSVDIFAMDSARKYTSKTFAKSAKSCEICGKLFAKTNQLKRHFLVHSEERKYKCDLCNKLFKSSEYRNRHMKIHLNEKKYECNICKKRFLRKTEQEFHMRCHTGEKPYQCEICGQNYRTTSGLNTHKNKHMEVKPFSCNNCEKSFYTKVSLKDHAVVHSDLRPYSCDICAAKFPRARSLRRHKQIHLSVK